MKFNQVNCWERLQPTVVSGFGILVYTSNSACFGPWHLFIGVAEGRSITCEACSMFFFLSLLHPLLPILYQCDGCLSCWRGAHG